MKKLLFALLVLAVSSQAFAKITVKDVLGDWKYTVDTGQGVLTGVIQITEKEGKIAAVVLADDGSTIPVSKLEIKDDDILYFEVTPDYDVIKVSLKIDGKKFTGTLSTYEGAIPITGEKKEKS